jgi:hypothetical protein
MRGHVAPNPEVITRTHGPGRANQGLVACDERGLPGIGKPPAFCATQDCESTERFARRPQGWVYAGPGHDCA